jgi:hypothetical protein
MLLHSLQQLVDVPRMAMSRHVDPDDPNHPMADTRRERGDRIAQI